jgi:hypothetical protein
MSKIFSFRKNDIFFENKKLFQNENGNHFPFLSIGYSIINNLFLKRKYFS